MSKNKDLKHRAICPECGKAFDMRREGFNNECNQVICADCFHERRRPAPGYNYSVPRRGGIQR